MNKPTTKLEVGSKEVVSMTNTKTKLKGYHSRDIGIGEPTMYCWGDENKRCPMQGVWLLQQISNPQNTFVLCDRHFKRFGL